MNWLLTLTLLFSLSPAPPVDLQVWFAGYNEMYFNDALPKTVLVDWHLNDPRYLGLTDYEEHGEYYHIMLNPEYNKSGKTARLTLLHEMCHVSLRHDDDVEFDQHGPKWQACMHRLANAGAMEDLW